MRPRSIGCIAAFTRQSSVGQRARKHETRGQKRVASFMHGMRNFVFPVDHMPIYTNDLWPATPKWSRLHCASSRFVHIFFGPDITVRQFCGNASERLYLVNMQNALQLCCEDTANGEHSVAVGNEEAGRNAVPARWDE